MSSVTFTAMASISDGKLKCACAKEECLKCECREHFNCQEAVVIIKSKKTEEAETRLKIIK